MRPYCAITFILLNTAPVLAESREDFEQPELRDNIIFALEQQQIIYQDLYARYSEQKEVVDELGWELKNKAKIILLVRLGIQKTAFENLLDLKIGNTALGGFDLLRGNPRKAVTALPSYTLQGIYHAFALHYTQTTVTLLAPPQEAPPNRKRTRD